MIIKSKSVEDTNNIANKIAGFIKGGEIILLNGDLGAGKTTFTKGLGKALGVKGAITSPTFTLLKTYKANNLTLVHVDAYRLEGDYFDELDDYLNDNSVILIEWSSCLKSQTMFKENLAINIEYISKNQRRFTITANGEKYDSLIKEAFND